VNTTMQHFVVALALEDYRNGEEDAAPRLQNVLNDELIRAALLMNFFEIRVLEERAGNGKLT
jgi:hypothetical protein